MDPNTVSMACEKMKSLCLNVRNDTLADDDIHEYNILPSFINLQNLSSAIYSGYLFRRFEVIIPACPPNNTFSHVTDAVIETADTIKDLPSRNIEQDESIANELFHYYLMVWLYEMRYSLLEACKRDEAYRQFIVTLYDYKIRRQWSFSLENMVADVEKAAIEDLEKRCACVVAQKTTNDLKRFEFY
ncbi:hypothetical protein Hdeb2414_s0008g00282621 [Helianthus debilis subsp. tardiflorus]